MRISFGLPPGMSPAFFLPMRTTIALLVWALGLLETQTVLACSEPLPTISRIVPEPSSRDVPTNPIVEIDETEIIQEADGSYRTSLRLFDDAGAEIALDVVDGYIRPVAELKPNALYRISMVLGIGELDPFWAKKVTLETTPQGYSVGTFEFQTGAAADHEAPEYSGELSIEGMAVHESEDEYGCGTSYEGIKFDIEAPSVSGAIFYRLMIDGRNGSALMDVPSFVAGIRGSESHCFEVRAVDLAGNESPTGPMKCTDDPSVVVTGSPGDSEGDASCSLPPAKSRGSRKGLLGIIAFAALLGGARRREALASSGGPSK